MRTFLKNNPANFAPIRSEITERGLFWTALSQQEVQEQKKVWDQFLIQKLGDFL